MKLDTTFKNRPLSWSQISSFVYDKEQWYQSYFLGMRGEPNEAMNAGKILGELIAKGEHPPNLIVPAYEIYEYPIRFKIGKMHCIGYADGFTPSVPLLGEYKTSSNKNKWHQKSVDEHGQLTMYSLGLYLQDKIKPENLRISLTAIPMEEQNDFSIQWTGKSPVTFETKRSMRDIMNFANVMKQTVKEMEKFVKQR